MSYSKSILINQDFKRAEIIEAATLEMKAIYDLMLFLHKIGTVDRDIAGTVIQNLNGKIRLRQKELFERTKNELLTT